MNNNKYEYVSVITVEDENRKTFLTQSPKKEMKTFQTAQHHGQSPQQFVTKIAINAINASAMNIHRPEMVEVHRVGDEKIGFGLKFEGGIKNNEKIIRLFIQSCSPNSPASRAKASWGVLKEGDEILEINNMLATQMSRLECVSNLKNSAGVIKLLILHRDAATAAKNQKSQLGSDAAKPKSVPPKPPLVPPRRINRTSFSTEGSIKPSTTTTTTTSSKSPTPAASTRETNYVNTKIVEIQSVIKPFDLLEKEFKIDSNKHNSSENDRQLEKKKNNSNLIMSNGDEQQKMYENVEIIPPKPLPRLTILMNDLQKMETDARNQQQEQQQQQKHIIQPLLSSSDKLLPRLIDFHPKDTTNPTITTTTSEDNQKLLSQTLQAQLQNISYEDFKFFDADFDTNMDDEDYCEDGEKLGPILGQLKLSEAYFNQHWNKSLLPTIGEAEEEFISLESISAQHQNLINNNNTTNNNNNNACIKMHLDHHKNTKTDDSSKIDDLQIKKYQQHSIETSTKTKTDFNNKCDKKIPINVDVKSKKVDNVNLSEKKQQTLPPPPTNMQQQRIAAPHSNGKTTTTMAEISHNIQIVDNENRINRRLIEGGNRKESNYTALPSNDDVLGKTQTALSSLTISSTKTQTTSTTNKTKANEQHHQQQHNKNSKKNMDNTTKIVQATVEKVERGLPDGDEFPANYFTETNGLLQLEKGKEIPLKDNGNHTNSQEDDISPQKLFKLKTSSFERLSSPAANNKSSSLDIITTATTTLANPTSTANNLFTLSLASGGSSNTLNSNSNNKIIDNSNKSDNSNLTQHYQRCLLIEKQKQNLPHWKKDEKSGKSVKDKIAMFSSENDVIVAPSQSNTSLNSQPNINYKLTSLSKKSMSCDNLDDIDASMNSLGVEKTMSNSSRDLYSATEQNKSLSNKPLAENKYLFQRAISIDHIPIHTYNVSTSTVNYKPPPPAVPAPTLATESIFVSRRASLYDLSIEDQNKKSNSIKNLLEKRRKTISKLRGLVIPEKVLESDENMDAPILLGLPEIKSKEVEKINFSKLSGQRPPPILTAPPTMARSLDAKKVFSSQSFITHTTIQRPTPQAVSPSSKHITPVVTKKNNIFLNLAPFDKAESPKRPAYFKIPTSSLLPPSSPPTPPMKPPRNSRTSLSLHSSPRPASSIDSPSYESDDDSNLSSSQISSPPQSPIEPRHQLINSSVMTSVNNKNSHVPVEKFKLRRTTSSETNTSIASSNSALTSSGSSSQGSSSVQGTVKNRSSSLVGDATKISASSLSEYYDRKNILSSARCRSGANSNNSFPGGNGGSSGAVHLKKKKPAHLSKEYIDQDDDDTTDGDELLACKIRQKNKVHERRTKNYILVDQTNKNIDNLVDKVINVAYIEQITDTDTDENFGEYKPKDAIENATNKTQQFMDNLMMSSDIEKLGGDDSICSSIESSPSRCMSVEEDLPPQRMVATVEERCSMVTSTRVLETPKYVPAPRTVIPMQMTKDAITKPSMTDTKPNDHNIDVDGTAHELITSQDLQLIIEEADPPLEKPEGFVVVLKRDTPESSIGIILAGGSDYEAKEISIYKILNNSPAFKDGRLCKGDRILSINGLSMRGLTHRESVSVLKTPRKEAVIVVTRSKSLSNTPKNGATASEKLRNVREMQMKDANNSINNKLSQSAQSLEDEISTDSGNSSLKHLDKDVLKTDKTIELLKDGAGLGFSIDGGFDSPRGNVAIVIKKVFMGGAAEKSGKMRAGDEIDKINGINVDKMTRIEVWNMMKQLPTGNVQITLK